MNHFSVVSLRSIFGDSRFSSFIRALFDNRAWFVVAFAGLQMLVQCKAFRGTIQLDVLALPFVDQLTAFVSDMNDELLGLLD
jgi:hypothetical protein